MIWVIHLHKGSHQVLTPRHLLHNLIDHLQAQDRTRIVNEDLFIAFNFFNVVIAGDVPKWFKAFGGQLLQRCVLAQPSELVMHPFFVCPVRGVYQRIIKLGGLRNYLHRFSSTT